MEQKKCSKCHEIKSMEEFYGKTARCKQCFKEYYQNNKDQKKEYYQNKKDEKLKNASEYRMNNKEKIVTKQWKKNGIKSNDFERLYEMFYKSTNCYLCDAQFDNTPRHKKVLDHDHLSGYPRFICCNSCNVKLSKIDNNRLKLMLEIRRYHDRNFKNGMRKL